MYQDFIIYSFQYIIPKKNRRSSESSTDDTKVNLHPKEGSIGRFFNWPKIPLCNRILLICIRIFGDFSFGRRLIWLKVHLAESTNV